VFGKSIAFQNEVNHKAKLAWAFQEEALCSCQFIIAAIVAWVLRTNNNLSIP
jgi:hypothetical protein